MKKGAWCPAMLVFFVFFAAVNAFAGTGKWQIQKDDSPLKDNRVVRLLLTANQEDRAWPDTLQRPVLVLRCKNEKFTAFVRTGTSLKLERGDYKRHTVTVRFDDKRTYDEKVGPSTDRNAFFFKGVETAQKKIGGLVAQMINSKRMAMRFTPFNSDPVVAIFDVDGLREAITPLAETCQLSLGQ